MKVDEPKASKTGRIHLKPDSVVYVVCPADFKTGGTELLHQYVFCAKQHGFDCRMAYIDPTPEKNINPAFRKYVDSYCALSDIIDDERNVVILPETYTGLLFRFEKARRIIWWESVDNYMKEASIGFNLKRLPDNPKGHFKNIVKIGIRYYHVASMRKIKKLADWHFVQSRYAKDFLESRGITKNVFFVGDYINESYLEGEIDYSKKEDLVCFNPAKGKRFTSKLIRRSEGITYVPLVGMSNEEVRDTLRKAKVYIDFGNHPGKDRFPREAASMGCCVITNKKGSALNDEDVHIDAQFKFDQKRKNIPAIVGTIKRCIVSYDQAIPLFEEYRSRIRKEKSEFEADVRNCYEKD